MRVDDEPESKARPTRTRAVSLRAGEAIDVFIDRRWVPCVIEGNAHSTLLVRRIADGPGPRTLSTPSQDD